MTSSAACLRQLACQLALHAHLLILLTKPLAAAAAAAAAAAVMPLTGGRTLLVPAIN